MPERLKETRMSERAEKGKKYDFAVIDVLALPVGGVTSFAGHASHQYDRLTPAEAVVEVKGIPIGTINLSIQPTVGINAQCVAVATKDGIDLSKYNSSDLVLRCTFTR